MDQPFFQEQNVRATFSYAFVLYFCYSGIEVLTSCILMAHTRLFLVILYLHSLILMAHTRICLVILLRIVGMESHVG